MKKITVKLVISKNYRLFLLLSAEFLRPSCFKPLKLYFMKRERKMAIEKTFLKSGDCCINLTI